jgi:SAM-dependent methyltransferase
MTGTKWLRNKNEGAKADAAESTPAHRLAAGGLWDTVGPLQFEFLVGRGLKPHHQVLDIGCGALRGGAHLINYLEPGCYHGIDREEWVIQAGREHELPPGLEESKSPTFIVRDDFDFSGFGKTFDFAIAQSVFTHIPFNSIHRALVNVATVLADGGVMYATFFENTYGPTRLEPIVQWPGDDETIHSLTLMDADPFHYEFEALDWLAARAGLRVTYIGDWGHPRNQKMLLLTGS